MMAPWIIGVSPSVAAVWCGWWGEVREVRELHAGVWCNGIPDKTKEPAQVRRRFGGRAWSGRCARCLPRVRCCSGGERALVRALPLPRSRRPGGASPPGLLHVPRGAPVFSACAQQWAASPRTGNPRPVCCPRATLWDRWSAVAAATLPPLRRKMINLKRNASNVWAGVRRRSRVSREGEGTKYPWGSEREKIPGTNAPPPFPAGGRRHLWCTAARHGHRDVS